MKKFPPQPMNQAQSLESIREHAGHKPVAGDRNAAAALLSASATIAQMEVRVSAIQAQLDELSAQEASIAVDRSKSPADVRAALVAIRDRSSDLRFERKRLEGDTAKAFAEAVALFPQCGPLVSGYFHGIYEAQKAKAVAAIAPFFTVGAATTPERVADELPAIDAARTSAIYALERVKGENPQETFAKYCEVIAEFGLDKTQAA